MNIKSYLQIARPANLITAISDILAGIAIAGFSFSLEHIIWWKAVALCISTIGLYGGGIVYNDVFDLETDQKERPERIIPSGKMKIQDAIFFGYMLFSGGIIFAWINSPFSSGIAASIAICALIYDKYGKHHAILGPINMGLCRGGNLILGMSLIESSIDQWWWVSLIPVCYIAAITMISRGEVHGGNKNTLYLAALLYLIVSGVQLYISFKSGNILLTGAFVALHIFLIFRPLIIAMINPIGSNIGKAVKAGVLSLIVMNAAWVSISGDIIFALGVLCLLPISMGLAKLFAVT